MKNSLCIHKWTHNEFNIFILGVLTHPHVFFSNMERIRNTRPMLYHRWGGLGNHRYQIGFSGDAAISWDA